MLLYQSKDFWNKFYIKFIESVTFYRKIQVNIDEVEDWIIDGEYLNPCGSNLFGDYIMRVVNLLEEFQGLVLKGKELERNGVNWPLISAKELEQLYYKMDSTKDFSTFFYGERNDSNFLEAYTIVSNETQNIDELYQFCTEWAYFYISIQLEKPLGDFTFEFFWLILEAPLIFKGFGVLLFHDDFEINNFINFINKTINVCSKVNKLEWEKLPEFNEFCRILETMSENWLLNHN